MASTKKVVIKVGTSTLTQSSGHLSQRHMLEITRQIAQLHERGIQVILVTSGAVTAGLEALQQDKLERSVPAKQMLSSIGQVRLMHLWKELFGIFDINVGQLLLTRGDFAQRKGYLNVRNTLEALLERGIIPIINENDTVATTEIRLGDNDNLAALAANLIAADLLILLTDLEGLFTADPRLDPNAKLIPVIEKIDPTIHALAGGTPKAEGRGSGGMATKIQAATLASQSGTATVIASAAIPRVIPDLVEGKSIGTRFIPQTTTKESRKRWLLSEKPQGSIIVDAGAEKKVMGGGASLLPVGVTAAIKDFDRGAVVSILNEGGDLIAVGITNYASEDISQLCGIHSGEILNMLGYSYGPEVIHRDNMTILGGK